MWWMFDDIFPIWGAFIAIFWQVLFWGVIVFLVVWVVRNLGGPRGQREQPQPQDPLSILKARYARGEITREQYQEMKQDLES